MNHSINIAAKRSGLTPHVIRVWEKRYSAVTPDRTQTNRRQYSDSEIERLVLLKSATEFGHKISNIANLPTESLNLLVEQDRTFELAEPADHKPNSEKTETDQLLSDCVAAIRTLDHKALEERLTHAALRLGYQGMISRVVTPLAQTIGDQWRDGEITAAHEHFASAIIRVFLTYISKPFAIQDSAPRIVVATPVGQLHELGAVIAAASASSLGWRVTYLGTNLPAAEIAGIVVQNDAQALGLSLVYPEDDPELPAELRRLRGFLPEGVAIIAGGRVASAYKPVLEEIKAILCTSIGDYFTALDDLRKQGKKPLG